MPAKLVKLHSGTVVEVKSIRLAGGNLLVPRRRADDRSKWEWAEVEPWTSDFKRWEPVAVDEPDPRRKRARR